MKKGKRKKEGESTLRTLRSRPFPPSAADHVEERVKRKGKEKTNPPPPPPFDWSASPAPPRWHEREEEKREGEGVISIRGASCKRFIGGSPIIAREGESGEGEGRLLTSRLDSAPLYLFAPTPRGLEMGGQ